MLLLPPLFVCCLLLTPACEAAAESVPRSEFDRPVLPVFGGPVVPEIPRPVSPAAVAEMLVEVVDKLAGVQRSVTAISGRLELLHETQQQQQQHLNTIQASQGDLSSRVDTILQQQQQQEEQRQQQLQQHLDTIEASQGDLSSRVDTILQQQQQQEEQRQQQLQQHLDTIEASQGDLSSRVDTILQQQQQQEEQRQQQLQQHLDAIESSQGALSSRVDTILQQQQQQEEQRQQQLQQHLDAIEASQGSLSGRADTAIQQQQQQQEQRQQQLQQHLDAIQAAINLIPKIVLGEACSNDTDCSRMLPEAVCGSDDRCKCRDGFRQVSDTVCRKGSRLTESCLEDADCQTLVSNTVCTRGECSCASGFWNHSNAECRQVSVVKKDGPCVGDQDCDPNLPLRCISGICSCPVRAIGGYEYRLVGGSACNEGNVEVRRDGGSWGAVCDDYWDHRTAINMGKNNAKVVCGSLGYASGLPFTSSRYGQNKNFYMDDIECDGSETHLMNCPYGGWGVHNCGAHEVAGVQCS